MNELMGKHITALLIAITAILTPAVPIIIFTGVLIFSDTATGIWAAVKRKEKITSRALGRTATKIVLYSAVILLTFGFEVFFPALQYVHMGQIASGYICLVELKSIYENVSDITGLDIWSHLVGKIEKLRSSNIK